MEPLCDECCCISFQRFDVFYATPVGNVCFVLELKCLCYGATELQTAMLVGGACSAFGC